MDKKDTLVDKYLDKLKNNRYIALLIVIGIILVSLFTFYDTVLSRFHSSDKQAVTHEVKSPPEQNIDTVKTHQPPVPSSEEKPISTKSSVKNPAPKVKLRIVVDEYYSESDIFVNGEQVIPIETTLSIKVIEIPRSNNIQLLLKGRSKNCVKTINTNSKKEAITVFCTR